MWDPKKPPKPLIQHLLKDAVYHEDSVTVYTDNSWTLGVDSKEKIARIFPVDAFEGKARSVQDYLQWHRKMTPRQAMDTVRAMQKALVERRGEDHAFHYDRSERTMLEAAAKIAAREPETAVLYFGYDASETDAQMLRLVFSPGDTIAKGWLKAEEHNRGVHITNSSTLVIAHAEDRLGNLITVHELVHAYDRFKGYIADKMPEGIFERTLERHTWLTETQRKWAAGEGLDETQTVFIEAYKKLFAQVPHVPDDKKEAMAVTQLRAMLNSLSTLHNLPEKDYPTPESRRNELMPMYEEQVGLFADERLQPDSPGRKLMELAFPELGRFVAKEYVAPLNKDYQKLLDKKVFVMEGEDIAKPANFLRPAFVNVPGRVEKDKRFGWDEQTQKDLNVVRREVLRVVLRQNNYGLQTAHQVTEDTLMTTLSKIYSKHCAPLAAQLMALEEFDAAHKAVREALQTKRAARY